MCAEIVVLAGRTDNCNMRKNAKNMSRYIQAWSLRQEGLKYREIGKIMEFGVEQARSLVNYINIKIKYKKPLSKKLRELILNYKKK